ncbi:MAG: HD domain-containing protein [Pseudobdellovibrionaceae bacterium]
MDFENWNSVFEAKVTEIAGTDDPAHDLLHFKRVVRTALELGRTEEARKEVLLPAAWLHDFINVPKNDPRRKQASRLSAEAAVDFLKSVGYPEEFHADIAHAIEAHSFSANIEARTKEAQIVQDADRLDGIGAIGIARCFIVAGILKRPLYAEDDLFCENRSPEDHLYTIDHFYQKLFVVARSLKTKAGLIEGQKRLVVMQTYLQDLKRELSP